MIEEQLASILDSLKIVWHWEASTGVWTSWGYPIIGGDLTELVDGETYWIAVTQPCVLSYAEGTKLYQFNLTKLGTGREGSNEIVWKSKMALAIPRPLVVASAIIVTLGVVMLLRERGRK
jgi:hypothetical protein